MKSNTKLGEEWAPHPTAKGRPWLLDEIKKLIPGFAIRFKAAEHTTGYRPAILLLNAPHHHAKMERFNNHPDPLGF